MKSLTIGLQGTVLNNDNLGCQALTYSLVRLLEKIAKKNHVLFRYVLFESNVPPERTKRLLDTFSLSNEYFQTQPSCRWSYGKSLNVLRNFKHTLKNQAFCKAAKNCDVIIDMTQGDSFSDIYGLQRFYEWTHTKQEIEKMGIPLIIGPQTIGPFFDDKVRKVAKQVIERAAFVMSRDQKSADDTAAFTNKPIIVGTDLAFMLPYRSGNKQLSTKIKIGINPSGLLCRNKLDSSEFHQNLHTNYDDYLDSLMQVLCNDERYEVHLIPHVGDEAWQYNQERYVCTCHRAFDSPIDAKNCIAGMDVFIGARMHATIAAFSSGVATIPTSYSPKFNGLYRSVGYPYLIDLVTTDTQTAVEQTIAYISDAKTLRAAGEASMKQVIQRYQHMLEKLECYLAGLD